MKVEVNEHTLNEGADIFFSGNIVRHYSNQESIVLVINPVGVEDRNFTGMSIKGKKYGTFSHTWSRDCFVQFHGTITISN